MAFRAIKIYLRLVVLSMRFYLIVLVNYLTFIHQLLLIKNIMEYKLNITLLF